MSHCESFILYKNTALPKLRICYLSVCYLDLSSSQEASKSSVLKFTVIYGSNIKQDILTRLRSSCCRIRPGLS